MGIFDEIKEIGGSMMGGEHAGALSAIAEYIKARKLEGCRDCRACFRKKGWAGW